MTSEDTKAVEEAVRNGVIKGGATLAQYAAILYAAYRLYNAYPSWHWVSWAMIAGVFIIPFWNAYRNSANKDQPLTVRINGHDSIETESA